MTIRPTYHLLASTASTNTHLASIAENAPHGTVVATVEQTAGRGQRGNSWESEPGKNITLSILLRPQNINARAQFAVSEIVSIAIVNTLQYYIPSLDIAIKWPNDIYVDNKKICGILIENSLMGISINHSIIGIGLNVNQKHFFSNAPNPVSLYQLTGTETPIDDIRERLCNEILLMMNEYDDLLRLNELHTIYRSSLWRRNGYHFYEANGIKFEARIDNVSPMGILTLVRTDGEAHDYAFKEVSAIL